MAERSWSHDALMVLARFHCQERGRDEFALLCIAAGFSDGPTATAAYDEAEAERVESHRAPSDAPTTDRYRTIGPD